jgi:superfamily II DNA or RNA helicase
VNGHNKGVVIAATGTGKTYLSAFDVKNFDAKRILFLAHRDEILEGAKATFIKVFGDPGACGKLSGFSKDWDKPFLFATVQTLSREDTLNYFAAEAFDYIIVDEFHHAEAATYRKVIDHFKPKFLLGLTATPDRMDGRDVLVLCDNNVVYEIRLRDALNEGLLTPFRYFGLSDPTIDYASIDLQKNGQFVEDQLVDALNTHERVDYVIEMIGKFGYDGTYLKALGFCASIEHAKYMTEEFNKNHFVAGCLTGEDTPERRQDLIVRLESDEDPLQIIFTVNIFNEGVDIPKLNVILYQNYTRNDLMYLFESDAAEGSWREGISKVGNHILLFINLKKGEKTADHLQYHDYLMDQQHFHWQTQNATFHESSRGQEYIHHMKQGKHIHLFIRKFESMHGVTLPFTYLGEIDYISSHGDRPMNIKWRLHHTIPEALFTDLVR